MLLVLIIGLSYLFGALTGPPIGRFALRVWRRVRGRRDAWRNYFEP